MVKISENILSKTSSQNVNITVDGISINVPAGSNLLSALQKAGVEIPHFCYHHALSIVGSCRMCKVKVEGEQKLVVACKTKAEDGMKISTNRTSQEVADEQKATLEFLLINHPLDCTICDQSGQCKLQDYYLKYSGAKSRFEGPKEVSVKAEILGNEVIYDGERCIACTRCIRFCREVTNTSELGMFGRGDKSVVGIFPGRPLENPFSGTVCDLCPVGAMTHRRWRFKARIWNTKRVKTVCPGCSAGCLVEAAVKDNQVVHVKAISSDESGNKVAMLCDEGRYGFHRFQPTERLTMPMVHGAFNYEVCSESKLAGRLAKLKAPKGGDESRENAMFISPFLTKEEIVSAIDFANKILKISVSSGNLVMNPFVRQISELESILIASDYAPNIKAAETCGMLSHKADIAEFLEKRYKELLKKVRANKISNLVVVGDYAVRCGDIDQALVVGALACDMSIQIGTRPVQPEISLDEAGGCDEISLGTRAFCEVLLPTKTVLEKSGVFVNREGLERSINPLFTAPTECLGEIEWLGRLS